jgi:hypothetical protein
LGPTADEAAVSRALAQVSVTESSACGESSTSAGSGGSIGTHGACEASKAHEVATTTTTTATGTGTGAFTQVFDHGRPGANMWQSLLLTAEMMLAEHVLSLGSFVCG